MKVDKTLVDKVAHLAKLEFDEAAKEKMVSDMDKIISFIDKLDDIIDIDCRMIIVEKTRIDLKMFSFL